MLRANLMRSPLFLNDLRLMQCFVTVAEERHVTRAAIQLSTSPSSVTRAIQNLETQLRCELIVHRKGRAGELTEAGQIVLAAARDILSRYKALLDELADLSAR